MITNDIGLILQPPEILQSRIILKGDKHIPQVLVHYEGVDVEHATWEELTYTQQAYPSFNLENNVDFKGGGNVTSGNSTRAIQEMNMEKNNSVTNNKQVLSDAMIVGKKKGVRMQMANSRMKDYVWGIYEGRTQGMVPASLLRKHLRHGHATEACTTLRQTPNIWPDTVYCRWHENETRSTLLDARLLPKWQHSTKIKIAIFDHKF